MAELAADTDREVIASLDDDLDAPRAIARVFEFVRDANRLLDQGHAPDPTARAAWERWTVDLFDVLPAERSADADLTTWVEGQLTERAAAKKRRDFAAADAIRAELASRGVVVEDTPAGPKWRLD
jgi:cysteinyl-tRNA synthetase